MFSPRVGVAGQRARQDLVGGANLSQSALQRQHQGDKEHHLAGHQHDETHRNSGQQRRRFAAAFLGSNCATSWIAAPRNTRRIRVEPKPLPGSRVS
jgi:hypothetical protein